LKTKWVRPWWKWPIVSGVGVSASDTASATAPSTRSARRGARHGWPTIRVWLPRPPDADAQSAASERSDPRSMLTSTAIGG
jgi:hypothetical protein